MRARASSCARKGLIVNPMNSPLRKQAQRRGTGSPLCGSSARRAPKEVAADRLRKGGPAKQQAQRPAEAVRGKVVGGPTRTLAAGVGRLPRPRSPLPAGSALRGRACVTARAASRRRRQLAPHCKSGCAPRSFVLHRLPGCQLIKCCCGGAPPGRTPCSSSAHHHSSMILKKSVLPCTVAAPATGHHRRRRRPSADDGEK